MLANVKKGSGFSEVLSYAQGKKESRVIATNLWGTNLEEWIAEFELISSARPLLNRKVAHWSVSAVRGEVLTDRIWKRVMALLLRALAFFGVKWIGFRHPIHDEERDPHKDPDDHCDHTHIVAGRVRLDGTVVPEGWDFRRAELALREIEKRMGLRPLVIEDVGRSAPTPGEIRWSRRQVAMGKVDFVPPRIVIQLAIDSLRGNRMSPASFSEALGALDVMVRYRRNQGGEIEGVSFANRGIAFRGASLGRNYAWTALREQLLQHGNTITIACQSEPECGRAVEGFSSEDPSDSIGRLQGLPSDNGGDSGEFPLDRKSVGGDPCSKQQSPVASETGGPDPLVGDSSMSGGTRDSARKVHAARITPGSLFESVECDSSELGWGGSQYIGEAGPPQTTASADCRPPIDDSIDCAVTNRDITPVSQIARCDAKVAAAKDGPIMGQKKQIPPVRLKKGKKMQQKGLDLDDLR